MYEIKWSDMEWLATSECSVLLTVNHTSWQEV